MIETAADRAALAAVWGEYAMAGQVKVPGQYDEPPADAFDVEGTAPTFTASRAELASAGVTHHSTLDSIATHDGRTVGPFRVTRLQTSEDGAFLTLTLKQST